ncbi:hypothetical protein [Streptomyces sp. NPDC051546]|uniref:hypothetical protein n=1 Tax=Streptomyces sp. NPDC051546 TaxID=3365655 RepID=UPI0037B3B298
MINNRVPTFLGEGPTYPETITLTRHLTRTPRDQTKTSFLDQTAHALGRLVLPPDDLLQAWIHTCSKQERPRHHCL